MEAAKLEWNSFIFIGVKANSLAANQSLDPDCGPVGEVTDIEGGLEQELG